MSMNGRGRGMGGRLRIVLAGAGLAMAGLSLSGANCAAGPLAGEEKAVPRKESESSTTSKPETKAATASPPTATHRVALTTALTSTHTALKPDFVKKPAAPTQPALTAPSLGEEPVARALRIIRECQGRFAEVNDYTCTFYKREVVRGTMTPQFVMSMKARTNPKSIYFKFQDPHRGREAIYVEGSNSNKILAHDVGITKFLAGTMRIDPSSARALEQNRHPITDAGIGALIETVARRWSAELRPEETIMAFDPEISIGPRRCLKIESIHPKQEPHYQFHKVCLYIDTELNLPIRFEGYDWPKVQGGEPELVEEYMYHELQVNVGLGDLDFDAANPRYSFGRF